MGKKMYRALLHTSTTVLTEVTTSAGSRREAIAKINDGEYVVGKRQVKVIEPDVVEGPHVIRENLPLFKDKKTHGSAQRRK